MEKLYFSKKSYNRYYFNKINILIQHTYNPIIFSKCIQSILAQTHINYRVLICYDDERCREYLDAYKNHPTIELFKVKEDQPFKKVYYNYLLSKVKEGWVMFLSEDGMLAQPDTLKQINNNIQSVHDILFWKVQLGKQIVFPNIYDIQYGQIQYGQIDTMGFCFHAKYKNAASWFPQLGSDLKYVTTLLSHKFLTRRILPEILTQSVMIDEVGTNIMNNDIAIIACYPTHLNTYYWLYNLLQSLSFKKIYIIYSELDTETESNNYLFEQFQHQNIKIIKVKNIGYDFYKYFHGMKMIKTLNETYSKVWLINDSFFVDNIDDLKNKYWKLYNNKIIGCYSCSIFKKHLQSYLLILDKNSLNYYMNFLKSYTFKKITNNIEKMQLVKDLEVNLNHNYIIKNNLNFATIYSNHNSNTHTSLYYGYLDGIFKAENFRNIEVEDYVLKQINHRYDSNMDLYKNIYLFIFSEQIKDLYFKIYYKSKINNYKILHIDDNIINHLKIIKELKDYQGKNIHVNLVKKLFFNFKYNNYTTKEQFKQNIKNIQKTTNNKKLVYTCNINLYDSFLDIDNKNIENDVDYIYISNYKDNGVCKNFKHVIFNIPNMDLFELNRMIKFDKTLFDCYEKILYIDSNVLIHEKLGDFWDKLDTNIDLVLFSHPERNFINEELTKLVSSKNTFTTSKWGITQDNITDLSIDYADQLKNYLFWLNVQLSTTKINIYKEIKVIYKKYKLKRDQVLFGVISNQYSIKTIKIKIAPHLNIQFFTQKDHDYGYIESWSNNFRRPFGGSHI